ncbi:hypothetical protein [Nitrosospira sp. Nsp2]|uniref:hypothetical protein n=1 Tax=Nitrosospira sp. Nsp2 TaxID=136548 RepID=UPI0015E74980|nr:hypothetical protein [Nitrosospira sp. Nsp2]
MRDIVTGGWGLPGAPVDEYEYLNLRRPIGAKQRVSTKRGRWRDDLSRMRTLNMLLSPALTGWA